MKKILLILLFLFTTLHADLAWMEYDKALLEAKKTDKTIMVMLGRGSCGVCNYMKSVVFRDKKVLTQMDEKILAVYIELDFDDIPNNLEFIGTPTFHFLNKEEKTVLRIDGGKTTPSFLQALEKIN
jgi:thioredoxin-related protein